MAKGFNIFAWILTALVSIGGIAWGVYGVTAFMGEPFLLVDWLIRISWIANTIYVLVGLAGLTLVPTVLGMIFGKK